MPMGVMLNYGDPRLANCWMVALWFLVHLIHRNSSSELADESIDPLRHSIRFRQKANFSCKFVFMVNTDIVTMGS